MTPTGRTAEYYGPTFDGHTRRTSSRMLCNVGLWMYGIV